MLLKNWAYALLLVFIIGALSGEAWPVAFSLAAAVVFAASAYWRRHALDKIEYRRRWVYRRGFPGEEIDVRIEIENNKLLPVTWLRAVDLWPTPVGPADDSVLSPSHLSECGELVHMISLRWFQQIQRVYLLRFRRRGVYLVGPLELTSGDLFGLFEITHHGESSDRLTIFPELLPLSALQLPTQDPLGDRRSTRRLFEDPTQAMSIRPYHPEDSFRRIHWPATARTGELQVKVFQPVSARVMMICLNAATQAHYWLGVDLDRLERMIKVAATLAYHGIQDGYAVGLLSNGCLAHSDQPFQIPPGRSTDHLAQLLSALAAVTPFTTAPFENYLVNSMPKVPYGASLMIVTGVITPQLETSLVRLNRYRANTTLLSLAPEPPGIIPGVRVIHLPEQTA